MSIENAILELAAAIRQVAEANQAIAAASLKTEESYRASITAYATAMAPGAPLDIDQDATGIEQDVAKVETDAKAAQQKAMDKVATGKAEIAAALAKAKAEKEAAKAEKSDAEKREEAGDPEDDPLADSSPVELDYEKDVKPKLVAVGKDRDQFFAMLAKFKVGKGLTYEKADKLPKSEYPALAAAADKILAARG